MQNPSSVIERQPLTAVLLWLVLHQAEDVMGIQFQAMQQNASLSFSTVCHFICDVAPERHAESWVFQSEKKRGKKERENEMKTRR